MHARRFLPLILLALAAPGLTACSDDEEPVVEETERPNDRGRTRTGTDPSSTGPNAPPPRITQIELPSFPPLGPDASFDVFVSSNGGLTSVTGRFRRTVQLPAVPTDASGRFSRATFRARDLGEGRGTLVLEACTILESCSARAVEGLIVDLTPPEIEVERTVASPHASGIARQLSFWVADDWVLGSAALEIDGTVLTQSFPEAYPSTLGRAWDVSRVSFDVGTLAEGRRSANLVARDAAGNVTARAVEVHVDATPPVAVVTAPLEGAVVDTSVTVRATATDPGSGAVPPTLEVWLGGARVAELPGPTIDLDLDTSSLPPGPTVLRVVARDEAGNESVPVARTITR